MVSLTDTSKDTKKNSRSMREHDDLQLELTQEGLAESCRSGVTNVT